MQDFQAGDYLIFQVESAYGLLRILAIEGESHDRIWHLAAYNEFFPDIDFADAALEDAQKNLTVNIPHVALTNRAFLSTQSARMKNAALSEDELKPYEKWKANGHAEVSDRSIRLMLGLR